MTFGRSPKVVPPIRPGSASSAFGGSSELSVDVGQTMRAWEDFLSGDVGDRVARHVRALIADSWHRSASNGVDCLGINAPRFEAENEIELRRDGNASLREAAEIPFTQLGRLLEGAEAMLVLTDREGVILDTIGDPRTLDHGRSINLQVGGIWNERAAGTNGIGTALWAGEPVFVHAAEHFCAGIKSWTCAGAPIRDPFDRNVIGVVDLSGPTEIFRPHNTVLVSAAAREVESALAGRFTIERARLLETCLKAGHGAHPDAGLVILDAEGRVVFARDAPPYLPVNGSRRDTTLGRHLLRSGEAMTASELGAALKDEPRLRGVEEVAVSGKLRGFALEFAPRPQRGAVVPGSGLPAAAQHARLEPKVVGRSAGLLEALHMTRRIAPSRVPILFEGETGVGKELFARLAHALGSHGPDAPYVAINCGAASAAFGEELFGRADGLGRDSARGWPGRVELAHGGVLCLDEIGEMPLEQQPTLLRLLEDKQTSRIGDPRSRQVDIRIVALTNRCLADEVEQGRFRRDLYFRIGAVTIQIPPLRRRRDDVQPLIEHFNENVAREFAVQPLRFHDEAIERLVAYDWPGNVRELRNTVELAHLSADRREIGVDDLPGRLACRAAPSDDRGDGAGPFAATQFKAAERQVIRDALVANGGNVSQAAAALGISRATLYRKMRALGIRRWLQMDG